MDSERLLVIDAGRVAEFDHPHILLKNNGVFHSMVKETGPDTADLLHSMAAEVLFYNYLYFLYYLISCTCYYEIILYIYSSRVIIPYIQIKDLQFKNQTILYT